MPSSSDQPRQTLADYVALALTPALIMALVISLVFFLAEVFYQGAYHERLLWTLFFFVVGAVGIARVSMMGDIAGRAKLYGLVLGGLVWIALQTFVEYPEDSPAAGARALINLVLIAVVWWCAHRLTWDCTNIDDRTDVSGRGLLQSAGLDADARPAEKKEEEPADDGKPTTWLERYRRYRERQQKKRALGVWVIYFSLAALPLFGLGQAFIDPAATERRRRAFWLMTVYVGSGLGLLLTTCFLSLRRYLRQKKLQMPAAMTGAWLTLGGTLVVLMLLAGALLPRPWPEYPWFNWTPFRSGDDNNEASRWALKEDSPAKDEGPAGKDRNDKDGKAGGAEKDKPGHERDKDRPGGKDKDGKDAGAKKDRKDAGGQKDGPKKQSGGKRQGDTSGSTQTGQLSWLEALRPWLKWITIILVVLVVLFVLLRGGLRWMANFSDWARRLLDMFRNLWARLFGDGERKGGEEEDEEEGERIDASRPFALFADPFESGAANRWTARQLVRYTFAALEAWARERDLARQEGETPLEFSIRLGDEVPALDADLRRLANLFARAAYAPGAMPANTADVVRAFWQQLRREAERSAVAQ